MSLLENLYDIGINLIRGKIFTFGELVGEVYNSGDMPHISYDTTVGGWEGLQIRSPRRVLTFDDLSRRSRARYSRHELIGRTSVLEKVGDEPDQISMTIKLVRELGAEPEEQAELVREYVKGGHEDYLIIGANVLGAYLITEVEEFLEFVDAFGRVVVSVLNLTFEEVSADDIGSGTGSESGIDLESVVIWG